MSTILIVPSGKSIPVQYAATAPVGIVNESAPVTLSRVRHHGKIVNLNPGATLSLNPTLTPPGFLCVVVNNTGAHLTPILIGFAQGTLSNAFGLTQIAKDGTCTLIVNSADGGATARVRAAGELI